MGVVKQHVINHRLHIDRPKVKVYLCDVELTIVSEDNYAISYLNDMAFVLDELFAVVKDRKKEPEEGSYTCYLFEKGLDKILKKIGEEASEVIIAAKNHDGEQMSEEICDLIYHLLVLMASEGMELTDIYEVLEARRAKIGNLKAENIKGAL